jgi:hypothetical protein
MKHLKHASETLTKTLANNCKYIQHPDKTLAIHVKTYATSKINTLATYI